jgi:hypothetical protein
MFRTFVPLVGLAALLVAGTPLAFAQQSRTSAKDEEAKLIAVLKSDAPRKAKADACRELGRVGTRESVGPLAALLSDEELSHMARYALEPIPDPAVDTALRDALDKVQGRILAGVIGSIGVRRDPKAIPTLVKRLGDSDLDVAGAAARALGKIGTLEAATALEKALPTAAERNRMDVCEGLLRCAEVLRTQGRRQEARAIYDQLRTSQVPEHVKTGASRAEEALRPRQR